MKHISVLILIVHFDISTPVKTIINIPGRRCRLFSRKKITAWVGKKTYFTTTDIFLYNTGECVVIFLPP